MGSPVSVVIAEIVMQSIEKLLVSKLVTTLLRAYKQFMPKRLYKKIDAIE